MSPLTRDDANLPTRSELLELASSAGGPWLSLFMPTARAGAETRQNPIRFKNLLRRAEEVLDGEGFERQAFGDTFVRARQLLEHQPFWQAQDEGLAVFLSAEKVLHFQLPMPVEERVAAGDRPYLKPLLPLLELVRPFYVLALSQKQVRLFRCQGSQAVEVDLGDTPRSLTDAVGDQVEQQMVQFHTEAPSYGGARPRAAIFHGHGAGEDDVEPEIERFLRLVDQGVQRRVESGVPVVVAAVAPLVARYRAVSGVPTLFEQAVEGNPDSLNAAQLASAGWKLLQEGLATRRERALEDYREKRGFGLTTDELATVIQASQEGRVDTLFVAVDQDLWGRLETDGDPTAMPSLVVRDAPVPHDVELLDLAAVESLKRGAELYPVSRQQLPNGAPVAAILRY